jgi:type IV secretory pathway TraG/TraD family ATPase VirD4
MNVLADTSIPFSTYAKILVDVATAAGQKGGQAFFKNAAQVAIQNAMATLAALDEPVTIDGCFRVVTDAEVLGKKVTGLNQSRLRASNVGYLRDYYREFATQPPEQKSGIISTVFNYLQPYTAPDIAQIFSPSDPTFDIKELDLGRLVTVKIPQKYQTEKKYVGLLLKILFYLHALRRYDLPAAVRDGKNLIVLVLDEAQESVLVSEDGISDYNVVDKIRGARATTINSTQSPTSYIPPMGTREKADVFLLNLGNKIYFTAADKLASEMLADSIGKRTVKKRTWGRSGGKSSVSWSEQDEHLIKPHILRSLPKHVAVIKHCERPYKRVRLPPSPFTKPKPLLQTSPKGLNS